ncbi:YjgN family protein [Pontivivens insulae]|uniref:YjgN family protein n=1 Tax=Pontivivens insulae TaxID=1639689 RepID=UPI0013C2E8C4|nr:DUF898 family protein [Pontivivens insulae]
MSDIYSATATPSIPRPRIGSARFTGEGKPLFWLMVRSLLLTIVTLGIYRFWMRTKLRQYYWSSIQIDDTPLEYTGTGREKFLGFLIALIVVALYLVIVNVVLFIFTLSAFDGNPLAPTLSFLALTPLIYFAQYRGRRYIMSRTRLRGIRFSLEPGAGRFVLFGLKQSLITVLTLGLLYPRMEWKLDQYLTQRTRFGDVAMDMHSHWRGLMRPYLLLLMPVWGVIFGIVFIATEASPGLGIFLIIASYIAIPFLAANYYVKSVRLRTSAKSLGQMNFRNTSRTGTVIGIWVLGLVLISVITGIASTALLMIASLLGSGFAPTDPAAMDPSALMNASILTVVGIAIGYILMIVLTSTGYQVFIFRPCIAHFTDMTEFENIDELARVTQSDRDDIADAEGFADALDMGAAF